MAGKWPTTATDSDLYIAVNELQNNLASAITNAVTSVPLNSATSFPTVGLVLVDNEVIKYTGISTNTLTGCTRGFDGTTAAAHSSSAVVSFAVMAAHHNVLKDEIEAIEADLAASFTGGSTSIATTFAKYLKLSGGTMSGALAMGANKITGVANGTVTTDVAAFGQLAAYLPLTGGTMSGALAMGSNKVTGLANASASGDAIAWGQAFTSGNHTFSPTTAGIVGTTTNDSAAAGNVGEAVRSYVTAVTPPTHDTWGDLTSIVLTAGDWDITGTVAFNGGGTITTVDCLAAITTTAGNSGTGTNYGENYFQCPPPTSNYNTNITIPNYRLSLSATTTVYLKWQLVTSTTNMTGYGRLSARRAR